MSAGLAQPLVDETRGKQPWDSFLIRCGAAGEEDRLGGKAKSLAVLGRHGLPIPAWFVVSPEAFDASLAPEPRERLRHTERIEEVQRLLGSLHPASPLQTGLQEALRWLCPDGQLVAVRSSAPEEDAADTSFAGQLESFLFVPPREVWDKVVAVWRSGFSERVLAYRRQHGLPLIPRAPAVLVQRMVHARVAGVAFSADPVTGRRGTAVVAAAYGLASGLVTGACDADTYHVDRSGNIVSRSIARKTVAHRYAPDSRDRIAPVPVPQARALEPALSDHQVRAVAQLARSAERVFSRPQDIEWAIENGRLLLLQSRPITSLARLPDPDAASALWDNSNIVESYGGITSPLTFSFARHAYEAVYRQFCRILGLPAKTIAQSSDIFRCMLGLVRGRVYYNLLNWYRLLALLPGYQVNRSFMEQMMGIKERLPADALPNPAPATQLERWRDALRLLRTTVGIALRFLRLRREIRNFHHRLDDALGRGRPDFSCWRPDELLAHYRALERKLLNRWDAPLVNDFFAMIFYGLLRRLAAAWCGDAPGTLHNGLLCGEGGMVSTEPAARLREMAAIAAAHPRLRAALCDAPLEVIRCELLAAPQLQRRFEDYLARFGERCQDELKLESPTLDDDPLPLLRAIGNIARRICDAGLAGAVDHPGASPREEAERRVAAALAGQPIRRALFRWVLRHARQRVRDRENLRFARTRVFGRVRLILIELGRRFYAVNRLDRPQDVFYLELNEVLAFVEGTCTTTDLRGLVAVRKAEFAAHARAEAPATRFETRGMVHQGNTFRTSSAGGTAAGEVRRGIGCCPGVVRGPVRLVCHPRDARVEPGCVLVAERTDPSWILLFPLAAGVLVERGSLLSHSAIVARELNIPTVVSIEGLTQWLCDGDCVEFDGTTGRVVRLRAANSDSAF